MRAVAGVFLLILGLWSVGEGGCSTTGALLTQRATGAASAFVRLTEQAGQTVDPKSRSQLESAGRKAGLRLIHGPAILVAGLASLIGGVLFFINRGRALCFVAPAVGVLAELLFFVLDSFAPLGLVKIVLYLFAMFAATRIGPEPTTRSA